MVPKRLRRHEPKRVTGQLVTVQEANAKEVKIEGKRPAILLELQVAAPEVLRHLSLAGERTAVLQFCVSCLHCRSCRSFVSVTCTSGDPPAF